LGSGRLPWTGFGKSAKIPHASRVRTAGTEDEGVEWLCFREPVSAWTHAAWMLLGLPATLVLFRAAGGDRLKQRALAVFGFTLVTCYGGSTLFHGVQVPPEDLAWFDALDAVGIYLLIAGTTTPVAAVLLSGAWRWGTLTAAWSLAGAGMLLRLTLGEPPPLLSTAWYLAMGWGIALCYIGLARVLPHRALWPLPAGGLLYSVGAVLNRVHWPVPVPGVVEAHEVFHVLVMAGSVVHFWFMLRVVAPFERAADDTPGQGRMPAALEPVRAA
jgi:hemolysin III